MEIMSFAQALNDAKQVIVQKSRQQQQTIVDQCSVIATHEAKAREQAAEIAAQAEQIQSLEANLTEATIAREQAESIIDRQGQRLTILQEQVVGFEQKFAAQSEQIDRLTVERDNYLHQLPTREDEDALVAMAALLTTKKAPGASKAAGAMRIGGEQQAVAA
jgi:chromosome segregation ATPase